MVRTNMFIYKYFTKTRDKGLHIMNEYFMDKDKLELLLEKYPKIADPKKMLEQYETPSSIAAHILWNAFIRGDIRGKTVVDLGCGNFKLGIGALVLGAEKAIGVDIDTDVVSQAISIVNGMFKEYSYRTLLIVGDIRELSLKYADTVIMNPPFGVIKHNRGLDLLFLKRAMEFSKTIYTIHKYSEGLVKLINKLASAFDYEIVYSEEMFFPIQMIYPSHYRKIYRVKIIFYVLRRK